MKKQFVFSLALIAGDGKFVVLVHVCLPGYVYYRGGKFMVLEHVSWPGYVYYRAESL